jgi:predicted amidophosphoribosyltransferase
MELLTSRIKCGRAWFTHYYLRPYLPLTAGTDSLSHSLLKFKQRIQPDLNDWIDCSVQLLGELPFSPETIILRALRHDETAARPDFPSALDLLGHSLAIHLRCRYLPGLLIKSRTTLPNKHLTRRERWSQLQDVYQLAQNHPLPTPSTPFLLIDDILTTGTTMRTLISAIRGDCPANPIRTFSLTRADYHLPVRSLPAAGKIGTTESLKSYIFAKTV